MTDLELLQRLDEQSARQNERVRQMLFDAGRPDLVADLDAKLKDIRTGIDGARRTWHSISPAQRRILTTLATGRSLRRSPGSRTRYDAYGEPHAIRNVCGLPTVRNLCQRELLHVNGGALDPEREIILTERGRFVLARGSTQTAC
jgi:hypothetical protein